MFKTMWNDFKKQYRKKSPKFVIYYLESLIEYLRKLSRIYSKNNVLNDFPVNFPVNIEIETISACNARCIMCPNSITTNKSNFPTQLLGTEVYKELIDEIANYKVRYLALFSQNEPLLDKRIIDFIRYGKEKCPKTKIALNTNAALLSPELSDKILKSGLNHITFSIHGWTEETMKKVSGLDFKIVLSNITYFLGKHLDAKSGIEIGLSCLKTIHFTKRDYDFAFQFSHKYGLSFALLKPTNRAGNVNTEFYPRFRRKPKKTIIKCLMDDRPLTSTAILSNGDVVACCIDWKKEEVLGSVYKSSLYEIWHSDKYNKFRARVYQKAESPDNFLCKRCSESV